MSESTAQVPVSLIERALKYDTMPPEPRAELRALLSQPTPSAEAHTHDMGDPDEWHVTRCKACGRPASVEFVREQCQYPTAEPCPECQYVEGHRDDCGRLDDYLAHRDDAAPSSIDDAAPLGFYPDDMAAAFARIENPTLFERQAFDVLQRIGQEPRE